MKLPELVDYQQQLYIWEYKRMLSSGVEECLIDLSDIHSYDALMEKIQIALFLEVDEYSNWQEMKDLVLSLGELGDNLIFFNYKVFQINHPEIADELLDLATKFNINSIDFAIWLLNE